MLPHEIIGVLQESGQTEALTQTEGLDTPNQERYGCILEKLGANGQHLGACRVGSREGCSEALHEGTCKVL